MLIIFLTLSEPATASKLTCASLFDNETVRSNIFNDLFARISPNTKNTRLKLVSEEAWPVQIHERLDKSGIYAHNQGIYRVFTKQVFHSGDLQIEILDSTIAQGRPPSFFDQLRKIDFRKFNFFKAAPTTHIPDIEAALEAGADPEQIYKRWGLVFPEAWGREAEDQVIKEGIQKQREANQEIFDFVFPHYKKRRGWTDEFIASLTQKKFETINDTRNVIIRQKPSHSSNKSPIIATIALTRKAYGHVKFFNKLTQAWEERTGSFGDTFNRINYSSDGLNDVALPDLWTKKLELLPMEEVFGDTAFLPRPSTPEHVEGSPISGNQFLKNLIAATGFGKTRTASDRRKYRSWPEGIEVDLNKPVEFSAGEIFEPTNFVVEKTGLRKTAKKELLTQLFLAALGGQALYTYNDLQGVQMYKQMGFKDMPDIEPRTVDGTEWFALSLSPEDLISRLLNYSQLSEEQASEIIERLEDSSMNALP